MFICDAQSANVQDKSATPGAGAHKQPGTDSREPLHSRSQSTLTCYRSRGVFDA